MQFASAVHCVVHACLIRSGVLVAHTGLASQHWLRLFWCYLILLSLVLTWAVLSASNPGKHSDPRLLALWCLGRPGACPVGVLREDCTWGWFCCLCLSRLHVCRMKDLV